MMNRNLASTALVLASASLGAIWATCPPEFGVRSVLDRLGQLEPKVLLAVAGYRYGDSAPVAVIEFVDRDESVKGVEDKARSEAMKEAAAGG